MEPEKPYRHNIGNAGEYYMASGLSTRGFTTTVTLGRAEKYDLIAINPKGKACKIQVKTLWGTGNVWRMGIKDGKNPHKDLFYAFVRLNDLKKDAAPEYWIFPSKLVAPYIEEGHKIWKSRKGVDGQKHKD